MVLPHRTYALYKPGGCVHGGKRGDDAGGSRNGRWFEGQTQDSLQVRYHRCRQPCSRDEDEAERGRVMASCVLGLSVKPSCLLDSHTRSVGK